MVTNHVYTVAGAKGGVGKTTTSINLGASLAEAGYATVTVELDLAMANLVDFLEIDIDVTEATTLHDVLAGDADVQSAIYETESGLSVVPSGTDLTGYAGTDLDRLPDVVETLRWHNDVVLLDTPAGLSEETVRPLQLADDVLLVSTPRVASIRNVRNTLELADRVETDVRGLVLTKSGTGASPGADRIADFLDVELLGHVPEDDAVPHSQDKGFPVISNAPKSGAAIAYRKIARQLVETPPTPDPASGTVDTASDPGDPSARNAGTTDGGTTVGQTVSPETYGRAMTVGQASDEDDRESEAAETTDDRSSDGELITEDGDESADATNVADADDGSDTPVSDPSGAARSSEHTDVTTTDEDEPKSESSADDSSAETPNAGDSDVTEPTTDRDEAADGHTSRSTDADEASADRTAESRNEAATTPEQTDRKQTPKGPETDTAADENETEDADDSTSLGAQIRSLFGF